MDEKIITWPLRFPAKENPNMEKALFDWPIVLQFDVKGSIGWFLERFSGIKFFSTERSLNQPKATRSINQSNHSISVRLLFLFCSRVFISRSYENRSICCLEIRFYVADVQKRHINVEKGVIHSQRTLLFPTKRICFRRSSGHRRRFLGSVILLHVKPTVRTSQVNFPCLRSDLRQNLNSPPLPSPLC